MHELGLSRPALQRSVIEARRGSLRRSVREAFDSRELLLFLAWRDIKVRYTQTALGAGWAILQPLLLVAVFSVFFGRFARVTSGSLPYSAFALAGLVPWTFFTNAVTGGANSLVQSANLISKVYFPRALVPLAAVVSWVPDLIVSLGVMVGGAALLGAPVSAKMLLIPALALGIIPAAAGVSIALAALNVTYRDVRYAIPFLMQIWLFVTPVIYPISVVPERYRLIIATNPMTGIVETARWALGEQSPFPTSILVTSLTASGAILLLSLVFFGRAESTFADVV